MCEFSQHDQEDDEARYPGPELIHMHHFVAEKSDEERAGSNDDDPGIAWHVGVHSVDQLSTDNDIDGRPADAGKNIEEGDEFHAVVAIVEAGENHLTQPESRTKGREESDRRDREAINKEDGEERIDEAKVEDWNGESPDSKGRDDHVGGAPLSTHALESFFERAKGDDGGSVRRRTIVPTFVRL